MARRNALQLFLLLLSFFLCFIAEVEGIKKWKGIGKETDFFSFRTRPDILAPRWKIKKHDKKALAPGYWFVAPYKDLKATARGEAWIGPHIYDQDGELVWSGTPTFDHFKSFDLRIAQINGTDMLTAIYPHDNAAVIMNKHYEIVETVVHSSSWEYSNMHDFNVVEDGTRALVLTKDAATRVSRKKSQVVGFNGRCLVRGDGMKYLDITTSPPKELFSWNGTDHIGLDETVVHIDNNPIEELCTDATKWDIHHTNAIDIFPDGDFLLSARSTSTLYKISHKTGKIVWRIGGAISDFDLPSEAQFNFQHHARVHSQNDTDVIISLMDNSKSTPNKNEVSHRSHSAGIILALHPNTMKGELIGEYPHPHGDGSYTHKRGSAHVLPNGNVLMGWADDILISEHAPDGRVLMEAHIKPSLDSYRCYKYEWVGQPLEPPNLYSAAYVSGTDTRTMAYVSWNGATEVAHWDLYESDVDGVLGKRLLSAKRKGFETVMTYEGDTRYVVAEALDADRKPIGKSRPVQTIPSVEQDLDSIASGTAQEFADKFTGEEVPNNDNTSGAGNTSSSFVDFDAWSKKASALLTNQGVALVIGFVTCGVLCAVMIFAIRSFRGQAWWRANADASRYESLPPGDQDVPEDDEKVPNGV